MIARGWGWLASFVLLPGCYEETSRVVVHDPAAVRVSAERRAHDVDDDALARARGIDPLAHEQANDAWLAQRVTREPTGAVRYRAYYADEPTTLISPAREIIVPYEVEELHGQDLTLTLHVKRPVYPGSANVRGTDVPIAIVTPWSNVERVRVQHVPDRRAAIAPFGFAVVTTSVSTLGFTQPHDGGIAVGVSFGVASLLLLSLGLWQLVAPVSDARELSAVKNSP